MHEMFWRFCSILFIGVLFELKLTQCAPAEAGKTKEKVRAYEFGFSIEEQQHRHEKRDENGIVMGEFGFITADGIYHVTVYATDENGKFKIVSMKNYPYGNPEKKVMIAMIPEMKKPVAAPTVVKSTMPDKSCGGCVLPKKKFNLLPADVKGKKPTDDEKAGFRPLSKALDDDDSTIKANEGAGKGIPKTQPKSPLSVATGNGNGISASQQPQSKTPGSQPLVPPKPSLNAANKPNAVGSRVNDGNEYQIRNVIAQKTSTPPSIQLPFSNNFIKSSGSPHNNTNTNIQHLTDFKEKIKDRLTQFPKNIEVKSIIPANQAAINTKYRSVSPDQFQLTKHNNSSAVESVNPHSTNKTPPKLINSPITISTTKSSKFLRNKIIDSNNEPDMRIQLKSPGEDNQYTRSSNLKGRNHPSTESLPFNNIPNPLLNSHFLPKPNLVTISSTNIKSVNSLNKSKNLPKTLEFPASAIETSQEAPSNSPRKHITPTSRRKSNSAGGLEVGKLPNHSIKSENSPRILETNTLKPLHGRLKPTESPIYNSIAKPQGIGSSRLKTPPRFTENRESKSRFSNDIPEIFSRFDFSSEENHLSTAPEERGGNFSPASERSVPTNTNTTPKFFGKSLFKTTPTQTLTQFPHEFTSNSPNTGSNPLSILINNGLTTVKPMNYLISLNNHTNPKSNQQNSPTLQQFSKNTFLNNSTQTNTRTRIPNQLQQLTPNSMKNEGNSLGSGGFRTKKLPNPLNNTKFSKELSISKSPVTFSNNPANQIALPAKNSLQQQGKGSQSNTPTRNTAIPTLKSTKEPKPFQTLSKTLSDQENGFSTTSGLLPMQKPKPKSTLTNTSPPTRNTVLVVPGREAETPPTQPPQLTGNSLTPKRLLQNSNEAKTTTPNLPSTNKLTPAAPSSQSASKPTSSTKSGRTGSGGSGSVAGGSADGGGGAGPLYRFKYILDYNSHHEEGRIDGSKEGKYNTIGEDGIRRIIDYIANENGYQPHIKLERLPPNEQPTGENKLKEYEFVWFN